MTDAEHLARSVLAANSPAGFALWKPWALDLADALIAAEARVTELEKALTGMLDERLRSMPGVNPDGTVSTSSMAETLAKEDA